YGNFLERDLISQKFSGRDNDLEDDHMDTLPSENTSEIPVESESPGSPPELIHVHLPPNAKVVRSKWLYKKKTNMDDIRAIRILIAIATYYDYEIWQMDVKTTFLNGRLDEDIYMEQPEGYGNFFERDLISQKFSGRDNDQEDDHMDTLPFENTSEVLVESKSLGSLPELIPVRAMDEEMNSMKVMKVWIVVDLPPNAKVVRSKWLYKKKTDMDGKVHTYKARLVAKGYTQTYRINYEETFSPVADIRAIRILITIAAYYDYEIWQMDVKTAFLNGRLDEDIYIEQPKGYVDPKYPNCVCKLQRSIYGLKQASRQWNKRFNEEIKKFRFIQNRDEPCVYRKASGSDVVFLILYVDDILIMGNNIPRLKEVKDYLRKCFSLKDLGEAAYILGIKIYSDRSRRLIRLSQSAYIDKILKKYNKHNSKKGYLPMEVKHDLSNKLCASTPEEVAYMKKVHYASAVGSIMYAVRCIRPDVAFA
nr:putative polyprotein [Tanacetum cinerariifolium]